MSKKARESFRSDLVLTSDPGRVCCSPASRYHSFLSSLMNSVTLELLLTVDSRHIVVVAHLGDHLPFLLRYIFIFGVVGCWIEVLKRPK